MWTFIGLLCFIGVILFFGTAIYSIFKGDFGIMKFCFALSGICLIVFLFSPFRSIAFEVFFDNPSSKQEVVDTDVEKSNTQKEEIKLVKNEDGELVEVHLIEGAKTDEVPNGWIVKEKAYNTESGGWMDVYRQPLTPTVFKEQFNEISNKNIADNKFIIKDISIQEGEVNNVFQVKFSDKIIINGVLNEDNEITNMVAFLEEDGNPNYNLEIQRALIKIFTSTFKDEDFYPLIDKLKYLSSYSELFDEIGNTYNETIGNVKYSTEYKITTEGTVLCIFGVDVTE